MKKLLLSCVGVLLALVLALAIVPFFGKPALEKLADVPPVLGYVELLSESSWRDEVSNSIYNACEKTGIQLLVEKAKRNQESQIQAVRTLLGYQVDAIVFSPVVLSGWDNILKEAENAGIQVILLERKVEAKMSGMVSAYVGTDYEQQGRQAAEFIRKECAENSSTVYVMELLGTVGSSTTVERSHGIRSELNGDSKYSVFYSVSCDMIRSKAKETCKIYFRNGQLPDVLVSYNDAMTYGAIDAMEELGILPGVDIKIISFDAEQAAVDLLAAGKISCEIETSPYMGMEITEIVHQVADGFDVTKETLLPFVSLTREDVLDETNPRGY